MQVPASTQVGPTVNVDNSAAVVRGFSTEVRSDVPPVQQSEGVRYTRGRPSDNELYSGLYSPRKKNGEAPAPATLEENLKPVESKEGAASNGEAPESLESDTEADALRSPRSAKDQATATLSPEDEALVEQLQKRDREVRLHEQAHQTAGGRYAGSANYEYQRGPDGKNYAVSGEVSVDVGPTDDPQETLQKARQVRAAALAPAQPSAQDRRVAMEAEQMIAEAQQMLRQEAQAEKAALDARNEAKKEKALAEKEAVEGSNETSETKKTAEKSSTEVTPQTVKATSNVASPNASDADEETASTEDEDTESPEKSEKVTAREALEEILLAGSSLMVQANTAGYVRPDAPSGDSGLLDVII